MTDLWVAPRGTGPLNDGPFPFPAFQGQAPEPQHLKRKKDRWQNHATIYRKSMHGRLPFSLLNNRLLHTFAASPAACRARSRRARRLAGCPGQGTCRPLAVSPCQVLAFGYETARIML